MTKSASYGSFAGLLAFSLFWCGITGLAAGISIRGIYRSEDARRRFKVTEGRVISSDVSISRGSKGRRTYQPKVRTLYRVMGREYVTDRYTIDARYDSGPEASVRELVRRLAPGAEVPVFYDPDRPELAVLALKPPTQDWFLLLFLQPFLGIGGVLVWGMFRYLPERRRLDRFLEQVPGFPWDIPSWGVMESRGAAMSIEYRPSPLLSALGFYVATAFLSAVIVGIFFSGFSDPSLWIVGGGFAASAGAALLGGAWWAARARRRLDLDPGSRTLRISGAKADRTIGLGEIREFFIRRPLRRTSRGTRRGSPVLLAILASGEELTIHTFNTLVEAEPVARKAGEVAAQAAGVPLRME